MKAMDEFTIYCTEEQTIKAIELGAPILPTCYDDGRTLQILYNNTHSPIGKSYYDIPTAEQMVAWLDEKGQEVEVGRIPKDGDFGVWVNGIQEVGCYYPTRPSAILGGIDFALILLKSEKEREKEREAVNEKKQMLYDFLDLMDNSGNRNLDDLINEFLQSK